MFRFALVGLGRWGGMYYNTIARLTYCKIDCLVLNKAIPTDKYNLAVPVFLNINEVIRQRRVDGVIIATHPDAHYDIARECILNNIPVLVEKPFTDSFDKALNLSKLAKSNNNVCSVGFQHLYASNYKFLKENVGASIDHLAIYAEGFSSGPQRESVSVLRDWGSHEFSIALDFFEEKPHSMELKQLDSSPANSGRGLFHLRLGFSRNRFYQAIFGNTSQIKRRSIHLHHRNGWGYLNGLDHGGCVLVKNGELLEPENICITSELPVDLMLRSFVSEVESSERNYKTLDIAVETARMIDDIETKMGELND
jgi:predicted dehydrogenase